MERLITVKEVAERYRVTPSWVYKAVAKGRIPAVKIGPMLRFSPRTLDRWLSRRRTGARI